MGSKCAPKTSVNSVRSVREKTLHAPHKQPSRGNLTSHAPPCGGGVGGGATILWDRNGEQKGSVKSVGSVREKIPQHERKNSPTCEKDVIKIGELICLVVS